MHWPRTEPNMPDHHSTPTTEENSLEHSAEQTTSHHLQHVGGHRINQSSVIVVGIQDLLLLFFIQSLSVDAT